MRLSATRSHERKDAIIAASVLWQFMVWVIQMFALYAIAYRNGWSCKSWWLLIRRLGGNAHTRNELEIFYEVHIVFVVKFLDIFPATWSKCYPYLNCLMMRWIRFGGLIPD